MNEYLYENLVESSEEIRKLVNIEVSVELNGNNNKTEPECIRGYLKTIDPVSNTLVILSKHNKILKLIPGHAISKITSLGNKIEESDLKSYENFIQTEPKSTTMTDELKKTKEDIIKLVEKNRFSVKLDALDGSIVVGGICKIKPPFREQDIECSNYKVSKNLKDLLKDVLSV